MTAGTAFLVLSLIFALAAAVSWGRGKAAAGKALALASFFAAALASAWLFWLILHDRFDIDYVWSYSSLDLPLVYKVSAFWAGQQGSFLLWLFFHAAAGAALALRARLGNAGQAVFFFLQALLAALVLFYSPFAVTEGYAPADGAGMNPLLQDPWMAVHPPLVFFGYALLAVPYAASLGALLSEKADSTAWLALARSWALAAWALLGAGIFVGAFWAYKVLGWGGWWGWDPVENSSLVPWLAAGVLVHLLSAARVRPTNLALAHLSAIFSYALALYGTFLARSGLLGDFSVHSFSGTGVGLWLVAVDAIVALAGLSLLVWRAGKFPKGSPYPVHRSREFFLLLGCLALTFLAIIVFIGMSMPLLTGLGGRRHGLLRQDEPAARHLYAACDGSWLLAALWRGSGIAAKGSHRCYIRGCGGGRTRRRPRSLLARPRGRCGRRRLRECSRLARRCTSPCRSRRTRGRGSGSFYDSARRGGNEHDA